MFTRFNITRSTSRFANLCTVYLAELRFNLFAQSMFTRFNIAGLPQLTFCAPSVGRTT
jgi:hypothetical protein